MNNAKKFNHRHSRESGNPANKTIPTQRVDKTEVSFRYAEICNQLDSRLRGNDGK